MNYISYTPKTNSVKHAKEKLGEKGEILGFFKDERGYRYCLVKYHDCGHECYVRSNGSMECNDKQCLYDKMSRIRKISHNRPEVKEKMRQINIENNAKQEVKEKHSRFFKEYWGNEENQKAQAEKKTVYFSSDENRKSHSKNLKQYYADHEDYKKEITARLTNWRENATDEELEEINIRRIKKMNTPKYREKASETFKEYYSDVEHKAQYLKRIAEQQRSRKNKYEMMFIKMLEDHHIEYVWQYPIITEDGKGFVIDFYLPEYELYVNIDGSVHGFNGKINNAIVDMRVNSDRMLDDYCEQNGLNIFHVDTRDLKGLNFNIKEVIGA